MITIVVGKMHQGKTTKLLTIYEKLNKGDGFVSVKKIENDQVIGYDILQLSTKKTYPFILKTAYLPTNWQSSFSFGPYSFSAQTLTMIETKIETMLYKGVSPIFLDEIGKLELQGQCFDAILKKILQQCDEVYIAVRDVFVNDVIKKYSITQKNILTID